MHPPANRITSLPLSPRWHTIRIMIETLYATDCPEKGKSECYLLVLTPRPGSHDRVYSLMEEHGRWDATVKRFLYDVKTIVAEDEMTFEDASAMYNAAKQKLVKRGFVHSFRQGCIRKEPNAHQRFEVDFAVA
jgi:hypothetical protein